MGTFFKIFFALMLCVGTGARAYETEGSHGYLDPFASEINDSNSSQPDPRNSSLTDGERLRKFNVALDALNVPHEAAPDFGDFPASNVVAESDLRERLSYIDPDGGLQRYLHLEQGVESLFQDFFTSLLPQNLLDYSIRLKSSGVSEDSVPLIEKLKRISAQAKDPSQTKPLTGLKFVLDPGHMGTPAWDLAGGKFVKYRGLKVSEGQINLWTALLTANRLEALGATVILTRTQDGTVASTDLNSFDPSPSIHQALYNSLDDWMAPYLEKFSDAQLSTNIRNEPEVKKLYSPSGKTELFISGEDLEARSLIIDREKPDVVIDIHFDAASTTHWQEATNSLEAFVPGGYRRTETGSRKVRAGALKHLLEMQRWNESVALAGEITQSMSASTHVPLQSNTQFMTAVKIQNGVYARNLYINRRNLSALTVYLECMRYDYKNEFLKLANNSASSNFHGVSFSYPSRLDSVADGIEAGILNYFKR